MWLRTDVSEMPPEDGCVDGLDRAAHPEASSRTSKAEMGFTRTILSDMFVGHMRALLVLLLIAVLPIAAPAAQSQRAVVRGVVLDPSGAPAPRIELRFTNEATTQTRRVTSDDQGRYVAAELEPGAYRIEVEGGKFRTFAARVELAIGQDLRLNLPLALETVSTAVDVRASFIAVERDSPALTTRIDNKLVTELPLDGRNFLELSLLAPGTVPAPQGSASSVRGDFAFVVNGAREDFTNYLLDGIYNVDPKLGTVGVRPPVDAIREFEVRTSTYDATFGRNGGGQVNIVTHSGTNRLAGTAYEFFRGGALRRAQLFRPRGRRRARVQPPPVRRCRRRSGREEPHVLLCGLRTHPPARRHHPCHQCADARRARRQLLAEPLTGATRAGYEHSLRECHDSAGIPGSERPRHRGAFS